MRQIEIKNSLKHRISGRTFISQISLTVALVTYETAATVIVQQSYKKENFEFDSI